MRTAFWLAKTSLYFTGAAVVAGRAGEVDWAVTFRLVGVAGTTPALSSIVDAVGACPAGIAAAVCVGGGAR
eukprot:1138045-Pelagomonas_calceolata.AAC.1